MSTRVIMFFTALAFVLVPTVASAGKCSGKKWKKWKKKHKHKTTVCIKGWNPENTWPIKVGKKAAAKMIAKGFAVETGEYYYDADGDGFGAEDAKARLCPTSWRADNNTDCDDNDASVHPGSGCGDDSACPCFAAADIDAAYQEWLATSWDSTSVLCEDWTFYGDGFHYDWAKLTWAGSFVDNGITTSSTSTYYSVDYVDGDAGTYCTRSSQLTEVDDNGNYVTYDEDYYDQQLTLEEHNACVDLILDYAAAAQIQCEVTQYP